MTISRLSATRYCPRLPATMNLDTDMTVLDRSGVTKSWYRATLASIGLFSLAIPQIAVAQAAADPINQPLADEFGVERKSGRLSVSLPQIISIGGDGEAALGVAFTEVDGSYVVERKRPRRVVTEVVT